MRRSSFLLPAVIRVACIVGLSSKAEGWGTPSQEGITIANIATSMVGFDYSTYPDYNENKGGHTSPDDRRTRYDNDDYSSAEDDGVDCSGLVLVSTAVADKDMPNGTAHDIATNSNYTDAVTEPDTDWRRGDIIGVDDNHDSNIEHMGMVTSADPDSGIKVTQASTSNDSVETSRWFDPADTEDDLSNYWWGTNSSDNEHRRDP